MVDDTMRDVGWFSAETDEPVDEAIETVTAALKEEGFGILTRIDLDEAFDEKLGVEFRPYAILGACNPKLAYEAVQRAPEIGLFLPCNVTVEQREGGGSTIRLTDPEAMLASALSEGDRRLEGVAADARARIERVAAALS
ncbi:MAG: DUF302 domain-containing protein [Gemmatimonadota bacterium]|nr:DUF302 domain-containing protein [Gemmatimonadota bacterium]